MSFHRCHARRIILSSFSSSSPSPRLFPPLRGPCSMAAGTNSQKSALLSISTALFAGRWFLRIFTSTFSGDSAGAPLARTGVCPTKSSDLSLGYKSITSIPAGSFDGLDACTYVCVCVWERERERFFFCLKRQLSVYVCIYDIYVWMVQGMLLAQI